MKLTPEEKSRRRELKKKYLEEHGRIPAERCIMTLWNPSGPATLVGYFPDHNITVSKNGKIQEDIKPPVMNVTSKNIIAITPRENTRNKTKKRRGPPGLLPRR